MDITVTFPGGKRVDANIGGFVVPTDQPAELGGAASAPAPFDLFLASIATCAGIYALGFCQARQIATDGLSIVQHVENDAATGLPARIELRVHVPEGFPSRYLPALTKTIEHCKVKKTLAAPPNFEIVMEGTCAAA